MAASAAPRRAPAGGERPRAAGALCLLAVPLGGALLGRWWRNSEQEDARKLCRKYAGHRKARSASDNATFCEVPQHMQRLTVLCGALELVAHDETRSRFITPKLQRLGYWEIQHPQDVADAVGVTLPREGVFLDLGANIGWYTLLFAMMGYQVIAVEPLAQNRRALEASLCLNPELRERVTVVPAALGTADDVGQRCVVRKETLQCSTSPSPAAACDLANDPWCSDEVEVRTLDDILAQLAPSSVDVVKMDIEGSECSAFGGGQSLFRKYSPRVLQVETWPPTSPSAACVQQEAERHGYKTARLWGTFDTLMYRGGAG